MEIAQQSKGYPVYLSQDQIEYAREIGEGRNKSGGKSRPLDGGHDAMQGDFAGAQAEVAVCLALDLDYTKFVTVHSRRPGQIPDLRYGKYSIQVKGRLRFQKPLDLIVPSNDLNSHIYVLVSVKPEEGYCLIRGWLTRPELKAYPEEGWKWAEDRPGATRKDKTRRYVPVEDLRPFKGLEADRKEAP